ncbi:hypothetical protein C8K44_1435 [Aminobacter sp. AP02]|nr:hypothetical protein C8K44_1435 [Aminobacter sp. AP02]
MDGEPDNNSWVISRLELATARRDQPRARQAHTIRTVAKQFQHNLHRIGFLRPRQLICRGFMPEGMRVRLFAKIKHGPADQALVHW